MISKSDLTETQKLIIECNDNVVVLACPGSGKSTTISFKIARHLELLKDYQGVIAISYTNKASSELKTKVLSLTNNVRHSFFGTIDKFCISEIIIPGTVRNNIETQVLTDEFIEIEGKTSEEINQMSQEELLYYQKEYIKSGIIFMKTIDLFSIYILENNNILREYIKSRYKMIFIDEYQDCSESQNSIFEYLVGMGLTGVAVGDPAQSIFEYAGKSSRYLTDLSNKDNYSVFSLNINHRCHQSIINYSTKFISNKFIPEQCDDIRVGRWLVDGDENALAIYIDSIINKICTKYQIDDISKIAVLSRTKRTAKIISEKLTTDNILFDDTRLENLAQVNLDAKITVDILKYCFLDKTEIIAEDLVETYSFSDKRKNKQKAIRLIKEAKFDKTIDKIISAIESIIDRDINEIVKTELANALIDESILNNILAINNGKLSVMTIHKSKGLEFDFVIILDLYKYIFPTEKDFEYISYNEDINLHYVSLTRAKKYVLMLCGTKRTNGSGIQKKAELSTFILDRPDLKSLRKGNI